MLLGVRSCNTRIAFEREGKSGLLRDHGTGFVHECRARRKKQGLNFAVSLSGIQYSNAARAGLFTDKFGK